MPVARDDFTGPVVDTSKWIVYNGYDPFSGENWLASNAVIESGTLALHGRADGSVGGVAWIGNQTYGLWEVDARFSAPADPELCPVFMLWPADDDTWPSAGELDFAEVYDPDRQYVEGWLHYDPTDMQDYAGLYPVDLTQWHTFAVEWRADHVSYLVDGVPWWTTTSHIPTGPMHLVMQIDNMLPGAANYVPSQVNIGSVRIYQ